MIVLVCPECLSPEIKCIDLDEVDETFQCEKCKEEFNYTDACFKEAVGEIYRI